MAILEGLIIGRMIVSQIWAAYFWTSFIYLELRHLEHQESQTISFPTAKIFWPFITSKQLMWTLFWCFDFRSMPFGQLAWRASCTRQLQYTCITTGALKWCFTNTFKQIRSSLTPHIFWRKAQNWSTPRKKNLHWPYSFWLLYFPSLKWSLLLSLPKAAIKAATGRMISRNRRITFIRIRWIHHFHDKHPSSETQGQI